MLVSAGAGSGKTTMLVERAARAVEQDIDPESIFVVTFTERAAAELAERIRARLATVGLAERAERIQVSTIHGLCGSILREHAFALGLDPEFRVLDEASAEIIRGEALEQALAEAAESDGGATLDLLAAFGGAALRWLVVRIRDRRLSCGLDLDPPPPRNEDLEASRDALAEEVELARAHYAAGDANENSDRADRLAALLPDATVEDLVDLSAYRLKHAPSALAGYRVQLNLMELAARGEVARTLHPQVVALVQRFDRVYAARKLAAAALDFADLELRARDLLVSDADARAAVQARVRHLLVDEFQDTNALQDSILELVAGEDAERVYVGDERQSIYRFRDADVEVFRKRRDGAETVVRLDDCFRSSDVLVGVLNEVFGNVFDDGFQRLVPRGSAPSPEDGVALELLVVDETGPIAGAREREASALAARLAALREDGHPQSGMVVLLRASTDADLYEAALRQAGFETHRTIGGGYYGRQQVSDLCAYLRLLRSRYDDRALLTVLASPLIGVSNPGLYALRRAAQTALFRGLEYGLPDGLTEDDARLMRAFRQRFDRLVDAAQQLGIADLLERIVSEHDYDLACLAQVDGRRRYANVRKLVRLARDYEALRGPDLAGFLALVGTLAELASQEPEAALAEEEVDAVRILTVHAAKGLEFDIVALADAGREPHTGVSGLLAPADGRLAFQIPSPGGKLVSPPLFEHLRSGELENELAEARRLVYVAMTRARERLIVSGGINTRTTAHAPLRWLAQALGLDLEQMPVGTTVEQVGDDSLVRVQILRDEVDEEAEADEAPAVSVFQLALPLDLDVVPRAAAAATAAAARAPAGRAAPRAAQPLVHGARPARALPVPLPGRARARAGARCSVQEWAMARWVPSTSAARCTRCSRDGPISTSRDCSAPRCATRIARASRRSPRPSRGRCSRPRSRRRVMRCASSRSRSRWTASSSAVCSTCSSVVPTARCWWSTTRRRGSAIARRTSSSPRSTSCSARPTRSRCSGVARRPWTSRSHSSSGLTRCREPRTSRTTSRRCGLPSRLRSSGCAARASHRAPHRASVATAGRWTGSARDPARDERAALSVGRAPPHVGGAAPSASRLSRGRDRAHLPHALGAPGRDRALGPVHGRAREPGDARAVRALPDARGVRGCRPGRAGPGDLPDRVPQPEGALAARGGQDHLGALRR